MARSAMPVTSDASDTTRAATSETTSRSPLPVTEETPISLAVKSASKELDVFTVVPTTLEFCACSVLALLGKLSYTGWIDFSY